MPNAGIHLLLVGTLLDRWCFEPAQAPFDPRDPRTVRAFMHGSLAPDIGYFPGGERLFSELAHLVRSLDLARQLRGTATTPTQRAYALGWITHVLADAAIHPLLNEAGGEHVHGDRGRPVSATEDVVTHMRLEVGLDAAAYARHAGSTKVWCDGDAPEDTIAAIAGAYRRIHGWSPTEASLRASHRMSGRLSRVALMLNRLHSATLRRRPAHRSARVVVSAAAGPILRVTRGRSSAPVLTAVLRPIATPPWLLDAVSGVIGEFPSTFDEACGRRLDALANLNLVTGAPADDSDVDRRTQNARRELARRVSGSQTALAG